MRLLFRRPPEIRFLRFGTTARNRSYIVFKIDPSAGIRMILDAHRADASGPREIFFDVELASRRPRSSPYEVLLHAMMIGYRSYFTRKDSVERPGASDNHAGPPTARRSPPRRAPALPRPTGWWTASEPWSPRSLPATPSRDAKVTLALASRPR